MRARTSVRRRAGVRGPGVWSFPSATNAASDRLHHARSRHACPPSTRLLPTSSPSPNFPIRLASDSRSDHSAKRDGTSRGVRTADCRIRLAERAVRELTTRSGLPDLRVAPLSGGQRPARWPSWAKARTKAPIRGVSSGELVIGSQLSVREPRWRKRTRVSDSNSRGVAACDRAGYRGFAARTDKPGIWPAVGREAVAVISAKVIPGVREFAAPAGVSPTGHGAPSRPAAVCAAYCSPRSTKRLNRPLGM
jgi:hypothetical protein